VLYDRLESIVCNKDIVIYSRKGNMVKKELNNNLNNPNQNNDNFQDIMDILGVGQENEEDKGTF